jgi:hypothetical protein
MGGAMMERYKIEQEAIELVVHLIQTGWSEIQRKRVDVRVFQKQDEVGQLFQVTVPLCRSLKDYDEALEQARRITADYEGAEYPPSAAVVKNGVFQSSELNRRLSLCEQCESKWCIFAMNGNGHCLFPLISGRKPRVGEDSLCIDRIFAR